MWQAGQEAGAQLATLAGRQAGEAVGQARPSGSQPAGQSLVQLDLLEHARAHVGRAPRRCRSQMLSLRLSLSAVVVSLHTYTPIRVRILAATTIVYSVVSHIIS